MKQVKARKYLSLCISSLLSFVLFSFIDEMAAIAFPIEIVYNMLPRSRSSLNLYNPAMLILAFLFQTTSAQTLSTQGNKVNSTATLNFAQVSSAGIDNATASKVAVALEYDRTKYVLGSVDDNNFYHVSPSTANATAGTLLKVEDVTNTSAYTLPPNTALSRIIFLSENLNGSVVPGSAFVLWPYMPRSHPDGWPVVVWGHGGSGIFGNCAPSHMRNLLNDFAAPYTLALQGYVVVAPDYAGLGVDKDANGKSIVHPLVANPVLANDLFFAVEAAQSAFSQLSKGFVIMGHSEKGM